MIRGVSLQSLVVVGIISVTLVATGCRKAKVAPSPAGGTAAPTTNKVAAEVEDQLKSGLYQLQPENLGIDSRVEDAVSVLNNWWSAVKSANLEPTGLTPPGDSRNIAHCAGP
ncbi:MAG TPA: hypothetical protein VFG20_20420 [Planctomycetaceae bacterium]|nr:hypothetical protein [Planctomycetaceae bacterium]